MVFITATMNHYGRRGGQYLNSGLITITLKNRFDRVTYKFFKKLEKMMFPITTYVPGSKNYCRYLNAWMRTRK